jgi:hypothetical protein
VSEASRRALAGAAEMLERGILPIFSLYWPLYGRASVELLNSLREYFSTIHLGYAELRRSRQVAFNDAFMCHRCSYMQLECDLDRADGLAISHRVS